MKPQLNDIIEKVEKANELNLTKFVFEYNGKMYICEWNKFHWSDPYEVKKL